MTEALGTHPPREYVELDAPNAPGLLQIGETWAMAREALPLKGLDLNLLITLRALLRARSVTRASRALGQSQPTVSRALASLRATFDDPLLVRSGREMTSTPLGKALLQNVERCLAQLDHLLELEHFDPSRSGREFRVAAPAALAMLLMPAWTARLATQAPGVRLVVIGSNHRTQTALLSDDIDIVLGASPFEHPEIFSRTIPGAVGWAVLGGSGSAVGPSMTVAQWAAAEHVQLVTAGRPDSPGRFDELLWAHYALRRTIRLQLEHLAPLGELLARTQLVASLPAPTAARVAKLHSLTIALHPLSAHLSPLPVRLSWRETVHTDAGHRWMRESMLEALTSALHTDRIE